jgi:phosphate acetyltransferase
MILYLFFCLEREICMKKQAIFVAATGQHVGKTTICLGLVHGLKKRLKNVGFIKPVGQRGVKIEDSLHVDKDVALFKRHFKLSHSFTDMSPVLIPQGFTRQYLDGEISLTKLCQRITTSYDLITRDSRFTVVEGTGHSGVGSIVDLNNAKVAGLLGLDVLLVVSGGLGSALDQLALNKVMFDSYGVKIRGIILNRVLPEKREMILEYFPKALKRWNIPLLGAVPYDEFLSEPTLRDFELLFDEKLFAGQEHALRHFHHMRMVATSADTFANSLTHNELIITSAEREDIILGAIDKHIRYKEMTKGEDMEGGIIVTGAIPPSEPIKAALAEAKIPSLYVPQSNYKVMKILTSHTAKIREEDLPKIKEATDIVEKNIDFDLLLANLLSEV